MPDPSVFTDSSGRRATWVKGGLAVFLLFVSVSSALFVLSLTAVSPVNIRQAAQVALATPGQAKPASQTILALKALLAKRATKTAPLASRSAPVCLGFYLPWEQSSLDSLRDHAHSMTHVAPVWLSLTDDIKIDQRDFDPATNPNTVDVIRLAKENGLRILPLISNARNGDFSADRASKLLRLSPAAQAQFIQELATWCKKYNFQGINFDLEQLSASDAALYPPFIRQVRKVLAPLGLETVVDVEVSLPQPVIAGLADASDFIVLMVYDEHDETGEAGPISSLVWTEDTLDKILVDIPEDKLVLGMGSYAYDWKAGKSGGESLTFQEAMLAAKGYRDGQKAREVVRFDSDSFNSTFTYTDDDDTKHVVWIADGPVVYNQWKIGQDRKVRGAALWALGTEDPSIWTFLGSKRLFKPADPKALTKVHYEFAIDYTGQGEILTVQSAPEDGVRVISSDPDTGFIDAVRYESFATPYIVKKSGFAKGKVVLTFDDGPDPAYSGDILDILKKEKAPGTFFVVGSNVESHPDLVQRMYAEGHEVGNHSFTHPNLGQVPHSRAFLEIKATTRVIEATIGVSSTLFRPPYNADSQPSTRSEIIPVVVASQLGLITVGENVDPNDWNPTLIDAKSGESRPRMAEDIIRLTLEDLNHRRGTSEEGNIVLLHDAGGDRSQTVLALPTLIHKLRAAGYEIVSVSSLLGKKRDAVMPKIPEKDKASIRLDSWVFAIVRACQVILGTGFVFAIGLGAVRTLFIIPLSLIHASRRKALDGIVGTGKVTVLIAAFNEARVIAETIRSVLTTTYPVEEVIVIDDGSRDGTSEVVEAEFKDHPLVRLIRKENGGKASALNVGLAQARGDILFCIDADTQLDPRAVGALARHFENPKIGAVAGNVQVGNVDNLVTAWQAVEYRSSQNMDRRAYATLNAITVIPGAIGMWRKSVVEEVGAYQSDTLAEDMDLTWRIRIAGYKMSTEPAAVAFTEAPDTWSALRKQRFRWSYGTFQCLWKHRSATFRHGWFGWFALPNQWLFQVVFQILAPLVDLQILIAVFALVASLLAPPSVEMSAVPQWESLQHILALYGLFFGLELISGLIAYRQDRVKPWPLAWLFLQRFAYRQLMYLVMIQAIWRSVIGTRQGWGKLHRTGTVKPNSGGK